MYIFYFIIMEQEEKNFWKNADSTFSSAVDAAISVENNIAQFSVEELLRCYTILTEWYKYYEKEADTFFEKKDTAIFEVCEGAISLLARHIEIIGNMLVDSKIEILNYFQKNGKSFSAQQRADALLFIEFSKKNANLAVENWKAMLS